jgi:hypothetical protein
MTTNALEKGHTMKKIFALACATSALAIVSTANAGSGSLGISTGDQFSVTIKGTVPGYCTLSSPGTFNVSNGSYTPSGNKNGTFDIANLAGLPPAHAVNMRVESPDSTKQFNKSKGSSGVNAKAKSKK